MRTRPTRSAGVTVLELLVTLAVATILASVALPGWLTIVASNRQIATANQLLGAVQMARSIAIARNREVVLCPNNGHDRCAASAADPDNWRSGYLVFINDPAGRPYQVANPGQIVAARTLPEATTISANRTAFVFRPLAVRSSNGTFRICDPRALVAPRAVIVSVTGRPRIANRLADEQPIPCPSR